MLPVPPSWLSSTRRLSSGGSPRLPQRTHQRQVFGRNFEYEPLWSDKIVWQIPPTKLRQFFTPCGCPDDPADAIPFVSHQYPILLQQHAAVTCIDFSPVAPHDFVVTSSARVRLLSPLLSPAPNSGALTTFIPSTTNASSILSHSCT